MSLNLEPLTVSQDLSAFMNNVRDNPEAWYFYMTKIYTHCHALTEWAHLLAEEVVEWKNNYTLQTSVIQELHS